MEENVNPNLVLLVRLDERTAQMREDISGPSGVLDQLKTLNGKVMKNQTAIADINLWRAEREGKNKGVGKALGVVLIIAGIIVGAVSTMLWH